MKARHRTNLLAGLCLGLATTLSAQSPAPHEHHHPATAPVGSPARPLGSEMDSSAVRPPDSAERKALKAAFMLDYLLKTNQRRAVHEKYLGTLGAAGIMEALTQANPYCHGEAHQLGQAVFARTNDLAKALGECGTGCTSACLHGVLKEAFGKASLQEITPQLAAVCSQGAMRALERTGTCAHGMGHALMMAVDNDVNRSIEACGGFGDQTMTYFCVTGVFMEFFDRAPEWDRQNLPKTYPCDTYKTFPAACYGFQATRLLQWFSGDRQRLADTCRALPATERSGCFHGLGITAVELLSKNPERMAQVCPTEPAADRILCIEGAIENLAYFDKELAKRACSTLQGEGRAECDAAASEGKYRLAKPSLPLYWAIPAVAVKP